MTRIDRRALFASGAAAALLSATGVSLDAAPQTGGRLRLAVPREGGHLERVARAAVFDTVTEVGPDGVLRGELCTRWQARQDARVWTFDLRAGVRFHDEAPLTADVVAQALLAHEARALADAIRIAAVSDTRLQIELSRANPHLAFDLADPALVIARPGQADRPLAEAVGTGRYRTLRADPSRHFLGQRVDPHYKDGRAGWADTVEIVVIPDAAVRAEALQGGYVDIAALPDPAGLQAEGAYRFHPSQSDIALAARLGVGVPRVIGDRAPLDDGRIAERWWMTHPA